MNTEYRKMLSSNLYDAQDSLLVNLRKRAQLLCKKFNRSRSAEGGKKIMKKLIPKSGKDFYVEPPFYCDYGINIHIGSSVFINYNCIILDPAEVSIGNTVLFGPNVQLYTARHPLSAKERRSWLESATPISIGSDVWLGGGVIVCPGVSIGDRCVIGAGSIVTKDLPSDVVAAGNPCRVIKTLEKEDLPPLT